MGSKIIICQVFAYRLTLQWMTALRRHLAGIELVIM